MVGDGNGLITLLRKAFFYCLPTSDMRSNYIKKHENRFHHIGKNVKWQPRIFPADPELIAIGDNVKISANVSFINHDIVSEMLNDCYSEKLFEKMQGCISIGNNVMIGANVIILPNVKIGDYCIIGAGSIVTNDIPDNSIAVGVPCRVVGSFSTFVEKQKKIIFYNDSNKYWELFDKER